MSARVWSSPCSPPGLPPLSLPMRWSRPPCGRRSNDFAATAPAPWPAPVNIEIYEPTIPIPASPQAELQFGYTKVVADSSASRPGRLLWPGDPSARV